MCQTKVHISVKFTGMGDRTCERCGKTFTYPALLNRHQQRKTPCAPIVEAEDLSPADAEKPTKCPYCGRRFANYNSMRRHVRDTCGIAPNERNGDRGMEVLYDHMVKRQSEQIEGLREELQEQARASDARAQAGAARLEEMAMMLKQLMTAAPSSGAQTIGQGGHHNVQTNVILNVWGKEDVARIAASDIQKVIEAGGGTSAMVGGILRLIYHKVPENRNAYLPNKKDGTAMVFEGETAEEGRWVPRPRGSLLPAMVEKSADQVFEKQFALMGDAKVPPETKRALDAAAKDLSETSPVGGPVSARLLQEVSPIQKTVLLENRPAVSQR